VKASTYEVGDVVAFKRGKVVKILRVSKVYPCDGECAIRGQREDACRHCDKNFYTGIILAGKEGTHKGNQRNLAGCFTSKLTEEESLYYSF
jgi:hypothetical protein